MDRLPDGDHLAIKSYIQIPKGIRIIKLIHPAPKTHKLNVSLLIRIIMVYVTRI